MRVILPSNKPVKLIYLKNNTTSVDDTIFFACIATDQMEKGLFHSNVVQRGQPSCVVLKMGIFSTIHILHYLTKRDRNFALSILLFLGRTLKGSMPCLDFCKSSNNISKYFHRRCNIVTKIYEKTMYSLKFCIR